VLQHDVRILAAGDDGLLIEFDEIPAARLHALALVLRGRPDVTACIVAHSSLLLLGGSEAAVASLRESFELALDAATTIGDHARGVSVIEIGVDFSEEFAPDLQDLALEIDASRESVIDRLTSTVFRARYLGFLPGFAYLEGLPDELARPRRTVPRTSVPEGTFAVAGSMAGFYSEDSPGGWNLLGRTDVRLWNPRKEPPNAIMPGDELRIVDATGLLDFSRKQRPEPVLVGTPVAEVLQPGQMTRIVGPAAFERYAYGIAAGGPFDPELAAIANQVVGNPPDAVVLECAAVGPGIRFLRPAMVSAYGACVSPLVNGHKACQYGIEVDEGDLLTFGRIVDGFRVVIAIDGGIEDPRAKYSPRPVRLKKGDVIHGAGYETSGRRLRPVRRDDAKTIRVMAGPHQVSDDAFTFFLSSEWLVTPQLNRMGIRMRSETPPLQPPADLLSCGARFGSVQWLPGGDLVLMGPDHPVTGGYLQPVTVVSADLWKLGQLAPGDRARFVKVGP
jgi:KipI family sensor histidine kinase inhibitor